MKQPNLWNRIKAAFSPAVNPFSQSQILGFNSGLKIYPYGKDQTFIEKGYQKNAWVYSIVSKCAKKFSQVPWYHYKIRTSERKTWAEYVQLTKDRISDPKAVIEAKRMRAKSVDQVIVDDKVSRLLNKANRNESGASFREQLYGYKLLTGEGNIWFSRPRNENGTFDMSAAPTEMFVIPKANLSIVKGGDPWAIEKYVILLAGAEFENPKDNVLMWKFPNYNFDPVMLSHLRGQAPLDAGLLLMQSSNEGAERMAAMNKNQGVAGLAYNESDTRPWTQEQAHFNRRQFNSIVNDKDLAGTIAYMSGKYGYIQFGLDAVQLRLLEQADVHFKALCNIFDVPWQLFGNADSYENRKQYKRDFIYDHIAVAAYSLRDELNAKLIREFNLDRERDVIDCDVMALPELAEDLKTQAETLSKLWQLTPNQVLEYIGYDKSTDPNMDKIYVPTGLQPLEQLNADPGPGLDDAMNLLNE